MAGPTHQTLPLPDLTGAGLDKPVRLLSVAAPYYKDIYDQQIMGVRAVCATAGVELEEALVPGALEIPTAIGIAARMGDFDGYVALGCVIRGETTHYDTVCNDSSRALTLLGLQGLCIGNGILTVESHEQAAVRAQADGQDKGGGAAAAALHLIALSRRWGQRGSSIGFGGFGRGGDNA
ncbi:6,7-dimethyl-8-ribityllumazine synthase [Loktanella fryxellensis]|uniref:6,7-dimethyl-8-ribityllumazine synthase n=1 Tax=Loktanella fryxellensis TaxID=245187 RepID=A0A1H7YXN9_9RHOB|nr:6,7-dimethyl-8-ribityllumazine synthase [Loktanella fryxellensis]SEM50910.1 6,7-dimethyl-8-ribityllumazine synthase [Loktanella fryxellensis]